MSDEKNLDLEGLDNEKLGELLLKENLKALVKRIRSGEATAADMNVALAACKALGIQMLPVKGNEVDQLGKALVGSLPFPTQGLNH